MNLWESVRMAFRSLTANKMRSFLTMLGIIIGTGAVIALLSVGEGAQLAITSQIQGIGSNLLIIFPGQLDQAMTMTTEARPLTREDALAIADVTLVPHVSAVAPVVDRSATVTYGAESMTSQVEGSTPDYEYVRNYPAEYGRFVSAGDEAVSARVAVIGTDIADRLVGDRESAVGTTIRLNNVPFEVIGVLGEKGGQGYGGGSADRIVIIPLSTAHTKLFPGRFVSDGERTVDIIYASVVDEQSIDIAIDEITQVLRQRQGNYLGEEDGFTITSQQDVLGVFDQVTSILTTFLAAIAGISLLVGGIGIMNIMLVSVTERTREIGIRKAVGARSSDVLLQFLIESIVLSVAGGLLGIAFGWSVSRLVNRLGSFTAVVSGQSVALAVGFSLAVGLFFGIYPARRAARMNPIDALRYE
jgi:putative ABC transport system permease protein